MQNSFRWYGPSDPVSLSDIRQSNAEYIVTSLHQIPYGEKWSKNDVKKRIDFINKHNNSNNVNLKWAFNSSAIFYTQCNPQRNK